MRHLRSFDAIDLEYSKIRSTKELVRTAELRLAEHIGVTSDGTGDAILFDFSNPTRYLRVTDETRRVLSFFRCDRSTTIECAISGFCRLLENPPSERRLQEVTALIQEMVQAGILVRHRQRQGWYTREMCSEYAQAREMPHEICEIIAGAAKIHRSSSILDIGTGPGSLANRLGLISNRVVGIDISAAFLNFARSAARSMGSRASFRRFDANKLLFASTAYDVVIASQMLHWLDPICAVRGLYQSVETEGSLFIVETKPALDAAHPFRRLLGFGSMDPKDVRRECVRHTRDYAMVLDRFRIPPFNLNLRNVWVFRQRRLFDISFARSYFFDPQIRSAFPNEKDPWRALQNSLNAVPVPRCAGEMYWLLIHFQKGTGASLEPNDARLYRKPIKTIAR